MLVVVLCVLKKNVKKKMVMSQVVHINIDRKVGTCPNNYHPDCSISLVCVN